MVVLYRLLIYFPTQPSLEVTENGLKVIKHPVSTSSLKNAFLMPEVRGEWPDCFELIEKQQKVKYSHVTTKPLMVLKTENWRYSLHSLTEIEQLKTGKTLLGWWVLISAAAFGGRARIWHKQYEAISLSTIQAGVLMAWGLFSSTLWVPLFQMSII